VVKQFVKLFSLEAIELEFDQEALLQIAKHAIERKSGARGLRSVIEKTLLKIQYDLAELRESGVTKIRITKDVINGLEQAICTKDKLLKTG
jgi:ATP-dependent Clp protease ATP-binding subunit ClpX